MVEILTTSHKAIIEKDKENSTVTVDFTDALVKGTTANIRFHVNNGTGDDKIAFSVSCGGCTKVRHIYKGNRVIGGEIDFTPNSSGIHRKAVYIYKNRKLIERILLKAQI